MAEREEDREEDIEEDIEEDREEDREDDIEEDREEGREGDREEATKEHKQKGSKGKERGRVSSNPTLDPSFMGFCGGGIFHTVKKYLRSKRHLTTLDKCINSRFSWL